MERPEGYGRRLMRRIRVFWWEPPFWGRTVRFTRVAMWKMRPSVQESVRREVLLSVRFPKEKEFLAIAIVGGKKVERTSLPCPPCGICRQFMREFCDPESFRIILENPKEGRDVFLLKELLPMSFDPAQLGT